MENNTPKRSMAERYPMTINQQLWDGWQIMRRYGDPGRIVTECIISRPIVDRALKYGNVKDPRVEKKISKFFMDRVGKEKSKGDKLIKIALNK